jgi:protease-4
MHPSLAASLRLPFCVSLTLLAAPLPRASAQDAVPAAAAKPAPTKISALHPSGAYADLPEQAFSPMALLAGGGAAPKPFFKLVEAIDGLAKADGPAVLIDLSEGFALNLAQLREVERAFARVRAAGKKTICYLENADPVALQVAALCDRVLMADMAVCDFRSVALSVTHFKDALDLLGVQAEMTRVGDYKGAVEPYVLSEMSSHLRRHYEAMLQSMNDDIVRRVAEGRRLSKEKVRELQQQRLIRGQEAKAAGLVDALVPWEGSKRALQRELGAGELELVDAMPKKKQKKGDLFAMLAEMFRSKRDDDEADGPEIVVLHLSGAISDGSDAGEGGIVSGPTVKTIDGLADDANVRGVVVRINSPGGSATASEEVRRALDRLAAKKPLAISMGELAASGGYWITCIGRPIVAEAGTITGSIGVFSLRIQAGALMRRLGVHHEVVALDDGPLMDAIDRPWSDTARASVQGIVDDIYERFIGMVAASRHIDADAVRKIAGGRVWSGAQAVDLKLVDSLGGLDDALAIVKKQAGVGDDVEVRHAPKPRDFAAALMEKLFDASVGAASDPRLRLLLSGMSRLDGLATVVHDALAGQDAAPRVYALLPADLKVR